MIVDKNFQEKKVLRDGFVWHEITEDCFHVYGLNYFYKDKRLNRFQVSDDELINSINPNMFLLAKNPSGGQIHFYTNSKNLSIHVKLNYPLNISTMSAVGQSGCDCYFGSSYDDLKFIGSTPYNLNQQEYQVELFHDLDFEKLVVINLPLYNEVSSIELGFLEGSSIRKASFPNDERIVLYGTSITQGGCASRPGLAYHNILSRKMQCEFLNFGFSGNGFGEREIAKIISEINNVSLIYINFEANAGTNGKLESNLEEFIDTIRNVNKEVKIVICSRIVYIYDTILPALKKRREELRLFQENLVKKKQEKGDRFIYYLNGLNLLGDDFYEMSVDIIHPNDLGFWMIANKLKKEFTNILK